MKERRYESILEKQNEIALQSFEATLAAKMKSDKRDRDRFKKLSTQVLKNLAELRKASRAYDTYPSSECTTDQENDLT